MTTILICDDDPVQRRLVEAMVRKFGYEPKLCENGEQAMRLLSDEGDTIDLVILDLVMPERDGMGVLAAMREEGIVKPVIVQTSQGGIDTVVNAMRAGASDFVVKPVGAEERSEDGSPGRRGPAPEAQGRGHDDLQGHRDAVAAHAADAADGREGRWLDDPGDDRGRERGGQGAARTRDRGRG